MIDQTCQACGVVYQIAGRKAEILGRQEKSIAAMTNPANKPIENALAINFI